MDAHSPWVVKLSVPLEPQQMEQDMLDHIQERQASLATMRYTPQTTRHLVKKLQSHEVTKTVKGLEDMRKEEL